VRAKKCVEAMSESSCDQEVVETFKLGGEQQAKAKAEKSMGFQTPTIPVKKVKSVKGESCSPSPTLNTPAQASANKKRKAKDSESGSSANSSLVSTSQVSFRNTLLG